MDSSENTGLQWFALGDGRMVSYVRICGITYRDLGLHARGSLHFPVDCQKLVGDIFREFSIGIGVTEWILLYEKCPTITRAPNLPS